MLTGALIVGGVCIYYAMFVLSRSVLSAGLVAAMMCGLYFALAFFQTGDVPYVKNIANLMLKSGHDVPEWMLKLKSAHNKEWKKIELKPLRRQTISTRIKDNIDYKFMK